MVMSPGRRNVLSLCHVKEGGRERLIVQKIQEFRFVGKGRPEKNPEHSKRGEGPIRQVRNNDEEGEVCLFGGWHRRGGRGD